MRLFDQFSKYGEIALASAATDYVTFTILGWSGFGAVTAQMVARLAGGVFSFAANKYWSFETGSHGRIVKEGRRFLLLYAISYTLSIFLFTALLNVGGLSRYPAKISTDLICFVFNFAVMKFYVFSGVTGITARLRAVFNKHGESTDH